MRSHFRPHRKCFVTVFFVCPWKIGLYVCLRNAEIEFQCSQGKEGTPGGGRGGGTLNVEVIGMLVGNFFWKTLKNTQILILNP